MPLKECYANVRPGFSFNILQIRQKALKVQAKGSVCCLVMSWKTSFTDQFIHYKPSQWQSIIMGSFSLIPTVVSVHQWTRIFILFSNWDSLKYSYQEFLEINYPKLYTSLVSIILEHRISTCPLINNKKHLWGKEIMNVVLEDGHNAGLTSFAWSVHATWLQMINQLGSTTKSGNNATH